MSNADQRIVEMDRHAIEVTALRAQRRVTAKAAEVLPVTEATCGWGNTRLCASPTVSVPEMAPALSAPAKPMVLVTVPVPAGVLLTTV